MWVLKLFLILLFLIIFWQDYKDRLVLWVLYPAVGIISFIIMMLNTHYITSIVNSFINLFAIVIIISVALCYSKLIMRRKFINDSLGSGDVLLFICLSTTFATLSFIIIFVIALLFSFILHMLLTKNAETVPLAGYMSLFFAAVYFTSFFIEPYYLFSY